MYQEMLLREQRGETPQFTEYLKRFPQFAAQLTALFEVHRALESQLRAADETVLDEDLARMSPLVYSHVIPSGTYPFRQAAQA